MFGVVPITRFEPFRQLLRKKNSSSLIDKSSSFCEYSATGFAPLLHWYETNETCLKSQSSLASEHTSTRSSDISLSSSEDLEFENKEISVGLNSYTTIKRSASLNDLSSIQSVSAFADSTASFDVAASTNNNIASIESETSSTKLLFPSPKSTQSPIENFMSENYSFVRNCRSIATQTESESSLETRSVVREFRSIATQTAPIFSRKDKFAKKLPVKKSQRISNSSLVKKNKNISPPKRSRNPLPASKNLCWVCHLNGHLAAQCPTKTDILCYKCGNKGFTLRNYPKCTSGGNLSPKKSCPERNDKSLLKREQRGNSSSKILGQANRRIRRPIPSVLQHGTLVQPRDSSEGINSSITRCWNCDKPGHSYSKCLQRQNRRFCYRCGKKDFNVKSCPVCKYKKNRKSLHSTPITSRCSPSNRRISIAPVTFCSQNTNFLQTRKTPGISFSSSDTYSSLAAITLSSLDIRSKDSRNFRKPIS